jgi:secreted Zn-dependent insulinase-like peptidase
MHGNIAQQMLRTMPPAQFEEATAGLVSKKRQTDRNIHDMCERWMHEVATGEMMFNRHVTMNGKFTRRKIGMPAIRQRCLW